MPSHIDPPPPCFHHSPVHVFAAASMALFSNGFRRIAGRGVEPPEFLAVVHIECGDVSAKRRKFSARIADEDFAFRDARRHRDGVGGKTRRVCGLGIAQRGPQQLSGRGVECLHSCRR